MSVNKVILIGNVGNAPDVKTFDNGGKIVKISVATTKRAVKREDVEIPERTDWHSVLIQGKLADVAEKYIQKGTRIYIEGEIRYREYEKKDKTKGYATDICCHSFELLSPKNETKEEDAPF